MDDSPRRSGCPIACTLDLIGDRWTLLVVRDLYLGKERFDEFAKSPEGIASNILADRLRKLEEVGLVERTPSESHRGRGTYRLTPLGLSLKPVLKAIRDWGLANIAGTKSFPAVTPPAEPGPAVRHARRGGRPRGS